MREKTASPVKKVKRAMFKALSVMTMGSMYSGKDQELDEQSPVNSPKFATSKEILVDNSNTQFKSPPKPKHGHSKSFTSPEQFKVESGLNLDLIKQLENCELPKYLSVEGQSKSDFVNLKNKLSTPISQPSKPATNEVNENAEKEFSFNISNTIDQQSLEAGSKPQFQSDSKRPLVNDLEKGQESPPKKTRGKRKFNQQMSLQVPTNNETFTSRSRLEKKGSEYDLKVTINPSDE